MNARKLDALTRRMHRLDDELVQAEKSGNVSEQIAVLLERARGWREYGRLLDAAGADSHAAEISALRDETTARQLQGGVR